MAAPYYRPVGKEVEIFDAAAAQRLPLLLKGPTGSGKSRFLEAMAQRLGRRLITVVCNDETSAIDLVGRYLVKGSDTYWLDGPLTTAVRSGAILYIDEIAEARPDTMVVLHSLTDHRRELFVERLGETIAGHVDFLLVASFNPGYQKGFKELKPSTRQRFIAIDFNYPRAEIEAEIVQEETGCEAQLAQRLVKLAGVIRARPELGLAETVSTRLLVSVAKLVRNGLPPRLAVHTGLVLPLSDDADTVTALQDFANLVL
ncbi:MAG: CbbQ/NirQ/NorQ/GpvN family protein [Spirochaetes bacterium]|nr:CbbQ/NirQ/NorQ/GpvN family protein [Spirochaetota bacterium]MBX3721210.1 CbbQ/NirQ/NorQ/GpvN family protein [Turneriella sp.]